jgi:hypothetical protein
MNIKILKRKHKKISLVLWSGFFVFCGIVAHAQKISVQSIQNMSFGAFYQGAGGGTVAVFPDGSRSVTGDVVPFSVGKPHCQATFEVSAPKGTIISMMYGPDVVLYGSNGGSMLLKIDKSDPGSPFNMNGQSGNSNGNGNNNNGNNNNGNHNGNGKGNWNQVQVNVGGTLTVGSPSNNKPGAYSGSFSIIFITE